MFPNECLPSSELAADLMPERNSISTQAWSDAMAMLEVRWPEANLIDKQTGRAESVPLKPTRMQVT